MQPLANVPVVIFQYAMSPYDQWHALAWAGALILTAFVLGLNLVVRLIIRAGKVSMNDTAAPLRIMPNTEPVTSDHAQVSIRNLDFFYGKSQALKNVNVDVPANAVTSIIGPSGCGKSTLLRAINRIYEIYPDQRAEGEIVIDGSNVLDRRYALSELRRKVGMVFQKPTPFAIVDPQQCRVRPLILREAVEGRDRRPGRGRPSPGRSVGRGEGQAERQRIVAVGRAAAAAVHRPDDRGQAGDPPARRSDLGT